MVDVTRIQSSKYDHEIQADHNSYARSRQVTPSGLTINLSNLKPANQSIDRKSTRPLSRVTVVRVKRLKSSKVDDQRSKSQVLINDSNTETGVTVINVPRLRSTSESLANYRSVTARPATRISVVKLRRVKTTQQNRQQISQSQAPSTSADTKQVLNAALETSSSVKVQSSEAVKKEKSRRSVVKPSTHVNIPIDSSNKSAVTVIKLPRATLSKNTNKQLLPMSSHIQNITSLTLTKPTQSATNNAPITYVNT
ncbi:unnamed protein product [Didymodactylos carnosus]|uniref:Uncharacterized protein n=1 Tax=Didymodactylos carnosus TaxID=1234261 RepID=A0A8S2EBY6_9BILA|nr:unnamed protein product [Didymodactylos carnosus]CAF3995004.1 unnamed protein product [Didymodactylos carnosus]